MLIINNNTLTLNYEGQLYSKEVSPEELTMIKVYAVDNDLESIVNLCFPTPKSLLKREGFWEEDFWKIKCLAFQKTPTTPMDDLVGKRGRGF